MEYTSLGRSGLQVSRFCLGTANFGWKAEEIQSRTVMDAALDAGVNFFDTADIYGASEKPEGGFDGVTERIIGRWFAQGGGRREQVVLATKVWGPTGPGPNDRGLSARHIRQACEASLRRLQTDRIDLYQMHNYDPAAPIEEILQAMESLIREGKVLYWGSSNWPAWEIARLGLNAQSRNIMGPVSEQCCFNLACRRPELDLLPASRKLGVAVLPWGPLCGGLLAGVLGKAPKQRRAGKGMQSVIEGRREQLEAWEEFCREKEEPPARVALAWLLHRPGVTSPVLGPRTAEQLEQSLPALEIELTDEDLKELDEIWPPFGAAPPAYTFD